MIVDSFSSRIHPTRNHPFHTPSAGDTASYPTMTRRRPCRGVACLRSPDQGRSPGHEPPSPPGTSICSGLDVRAAAGRSENWLIPSATRSFSPADGTLALRSRVATDRAVESWENRIRRRIIGWKASQGGGRSTAMVPALPIRRTRRRVAVIRWGHSKVRYPSEVVQMYSDARRNFRRR